MRSRQTSAQAARRFFCAVHHAACLLTLREQLLQPPCIGPAPTSKFELQQVLSEVQADVKPHQQAEKGRLATLTSPPRFSSARSHARHCARADRGGDSSPEFPSAFASGPVREADADPPLHLFGRVLLPGRSTSRGGPVTPSEWQARSHALPDGLNRRASQLRSG